MLTKQFREFERWADEQEKIKQAKLKNENLPKKDLLKKSKKISELVLSKIKK